MWPIAFSATPEYAHSMREVCAEYARNVQINFWAAYVPLPLPEILWMVSVCAEYKRNLQSSTAPSTQSSTAPSTPSSVAPSTQSSTAPSTQSSTDPGTQVMLRSTE